MIVVYGLKNCDSCQKARNWMRELDIQHRFIDYRKDFFDDATLSSWLSELGWKKILNRRSTTWRSIPAYMKEDLNPDSVKALMVEFPTLIKRPIFETGGPLLVGFKQEQKAYLTARQSSVNKL